MSEYFSFTSQCANPGICGCIVDTFLIHNLPQSVTINMILSYVHHIGSQTVGMNGDALTKAAIPWLLKNRPEYAKQWFDT